MNLKYDTGARQQGCIQLPPTGEGITGEAYVYTLGYNYTYNYIYKRHI